MVWVGQEWRKFTHKTSCCSALLFLKPLPIQGGLVIWCPAPNALWAKLCPDPSLRLCSAGPAGVIPAQKVPRSPTLTLLLVQNAHKARNLQLPTEVGSRACWIWKEGSEDAGTATCLALPWLSLTGFLRTRNAGEKMDHSHSKLSITTRRPVQHGLRKGIGKRLYTHSKRQRAACRRHTWRPRKKFLGLHLDMPLPNSGRGELQSRNSWFLGNLSPGHSSFLTAAQVTGSQQAGVSNFRYHLWELAPCSP